MIQMQEITHKRALNILDAYLYLKICWGQAWGHLSMPIILIDKILTAGIFLKVFGFNNYWILLVAGIFIVIFMLFAGHIIVRKGILSRETSMGNYYNPEIQKLLNGKCKHCRKSNN